MARFFFTLGTLTVIAAWLLAGTGLVVESVGLFVGGLFSMFGGVLLTVIGYAAERASI